MFRKYIRIFTVLLTIVFLTGLVIGNTPNGEEISGNTVPGSYIVTFHDNGNDRGSRPDRGSSNIPENALERIEELDEKLGHIDLEEKVVRNFEHGFKGIHVEDMSSEDVMQLKRQEEVEYVIPDYIVETRMEDARESVGMEKIHEEGFGSDNLTGEGVNIAVLDTGVDYTHEVFGSCEEFSGCEKFYDGYDFVNDDDEDPMDIDDDSHGTNVSSIAAGKKVEDEFPGGVAPEAKIGAYKVLEHGSGSISDIVEGLEHILKNHDEHGTDIVSMSLGGYVNRRHLDEMTGLFRSIFDEMDDKNITVVVAAGNDGDFYRTLSMPGHMEEVITVGAVDGNDDVTDFSSRGPFIKFDESEDEWVMINKPDLVAPGIIKAAVNDNDYEEMTGTSMSTPMVSGAAALLKEDDGSLKPDEIRSKLVNTADDLGETVFDQGAGRLNISSALEQPETFFEKTNPTFTSKRQEDSDSVELEIEINNETLIEDVNYPETLGYFDENFDYKNEGPVNISSSTEVDDYRKILEFELDLNEDSDGYHEALIELKDEDNNSWNLPVSWFHHYPNELKITVDNDFFEEEEHISSNLFKDSGEPFFEGYYDSVSYQYYDVDDEGKATKEHYYSTYFYDKTIGLWDTDTDYYAVASKLNGSKPFVLSENISLEEKEKVLRKEPKKVLLPSTVEDRTSLINETTFLNHDDKPFVDTFIGEEYERRNEHSFYIGPDLPDFLELTTEYISFESVECEEIDDCPEENYKDFVGSKSVVYGNISINESNFNESNFENTFTKEEEFSIDYETPFNIDKENESGVVGILGEKVAVPLKRSYYSAGEIEENDWEDVSENPMFNVEEKYEEVFSSEGNFVSSTEMYPLIPVLEEDGGELEFENLCRNDSTDCFRTEKDIVNYDGSSADYSETIRFGEYLEAGTDLPLQNSTVVETVEITQSTDLPVIEGFKNYEPVRSEWEDVEILFDGETNVTLREWNSSKTDGWQELVEEEDVEELSLEEVEGLHEIDGEEYVSLNMTLEREQNGEINSYHITFWRFAREEAVEVDIDFRPEIILFEKSEFSGDAPSHLNLLIEGGRGNTVSVDEIFNTSIKGCPEPGLVEWEGSSFNSPYSSELGSENFSIETLEQQYDHVDVSGVNTLSINNPGCSGEAFFGYTKDDGWETTESISFEDNDKIEYEWYGDEDYEVGETVDWNLTISNDDLNVESEQNSFNLVSNILMPEELEVGRTTQILTYHEHPVNVSANLTNFSLEWEGTELEMDEVFNVSLDANYTQDFDDADSEDYNWDLNESGGFRGNNFLYYNSSKERIPNYYHLESENFSDPEFISFRYRVDTEDIIGDGNHSFRFSAGEEEPSTFIENTTRTEWKLYSKNISDVDLDEKGFNWTVDYDGSGEEVLFMIDDIRVGNHSEKLYSTSFVPRNPAKYEIKGSNFENRSVEAKIGDVHKENFESGYNEYPSYPISLENKEKIGGFDDYTIQVFIEDLVGLETCELEKQADFENLNQSEKKVSKDHITEEPFIDTYEINFTYIGDENNGCEECGVSVKSNWGTIEREVFNHTIETYDGKEIVFNKTENVSINTYFSDEFLTKIGEEENKTVIPYNITETDDEYSFKSVADNGIFNVTTEETNISGSNLEFYIDRKDTENDDLSEHYFFNFYRIYMNISDGVNHSVSYEIPGEFDAKDENYNLYRTGSGWESIRNVTIENGIVKTLEPISESRLQLGFDVPHSIKDVGGGDEVNIQTGYYWINVSREGLEGWNYSLGEEETGVSFIPKKSGETYNVEWLDEDDNLIEEESFDTFPSIEPVIFETLSEIEGVRDAKIFFEGDDLNVEGMLNERYPERFSEETGEPYNLSRCPEEECLDINITGNLDIGDESYANVSLSNSLNESVEQVHYHDTEEVDIEWDGGYRELKLGISDETFFGDQSYFFEDTGSGDRDSKLLPVNTSISWKVAKEDGSFQATGETTEYIESEDESFKVKTVYLQDIELDEKILDYVYAVDFGLESGSTGFDTEESGDVFYCDDFDFEDEECDSDWSSSRSGAEAIAVGEELEDVECFDDDDCGDDEICDDGECVDMEDFLEEEGLLEEEELEDEEEEDEDVAERDEEDPFEEFELLIDENESETFNFRESSIRHVTINTLDVVSGTVRSISSMDLPDGVEEEPGRKVYEYISYEKIDLLEDGIENVTFEFTVNKDWFEEENVNNETVRLERYSDENWNELETEYLETDDDEIVYRAFSDSLSHYAITADDSFPDIIVTDLEIDETDLGVGQVFNISVTVENRGDSEGVHELEVLSENLSIQEEVLLDANSSETFSFNHSFEETGEKVIMAGEESLTVSVDDSLEEGLSWWFIALIVVFVLVAALIVFAITSDIVDSEKLKNVLDNIKKEDKEEKEDMLKKTAKEVERTFVKIDESKGKKNITVSFKERNDD